MEAKCGAQHLWKWWSQAASVALWWVEHHGCLGQLEELVIYQTELVLVQLQEEGGRTLLHYWDRSAAVSIGLSLPPLTLLPSHLPTAGPELAVPYRSFSRNRIYHQTDLVGWWTKSQPVPVTRLVSMCQSSCEQLCSTFHWGALGIV